MAKFVMQYLRHINLYKHTALALLGVLGSIVILKLKMQNGAGTTPDSVVYI